MTTDVMRYARERYLNDPEFHARVEMVVAILMRDHPDIMSGERAGLATIAAAMGLAMEWVDPTTGQVFDR